MIARIAVEIRIGCMNIGSGIAGMVVGMAVIADDRMHEQIIVGRRRRRIGSCRLDLRLGLVKLLGHLYF